MKRNEAERCEAEIAQGWTTKTTRCLSRASWALVKSGCRWAPKKACGTHKGAAERTMLDTTYRRIK